MAAEATLAGILHAPHTGGEKPAAHAALWWCPCPVTRLCGFRGPTVRASIARPSWAADPLPRPPNASFLISAAPEPAGHCASVRTSGPGGD